MEYRDKRNEWVREVEARRRDVEFPQASKEEVESCRNYKQQPLPLLGKMFYAALALCAVVCVLFVTYRLHRAGRLLEAVLVLTLTAFLSLGPIFVVLAWSTHRSLREIRDLNRNRKIRPHRY